MRLDRKFIKEMVIRVHRFHPRVLPPKQPVNYFEFIFWGLVLLLVLIYGCSSAMAYTDQDAIRCIVGEASNQGLEGMVLVGETIRNRNSVDGCYGMRARHTGLEKKSTWDNAEIAWQLSQYSFSTHSATGWGSKEDFKNKKWAKGKRIVARYKNQIFYRED